MSDNKLMVMVARDEANFGEGFRIAVMNAIQKEAREEIKRLKKENNQLRRDHAYEKEKRRQLFANGRKKVRT